MCRAKREREERQAHHHRSSFFDGGMAMSPRPIELTWPIALVALETSTDWEEEKKKRVFCLLFCLSLKGRNSLGDAKTVPSRDR